MAEVKRKLSVDEAKGETESKTGSTTGGETKGKKGKSKADGAAGSRTRYPMDEIIVILPREGAAQSSARGKRLRGGGAARLRRAVDKRVAENAEKLAELLTNKALDGDLASARMLAALSEGKTAVQEQVRKRRRPSLALQLASEKEWEGEEAGLDLEASC